MARNMTTIAYIEKGSDRRATFKKRRGGLLKKVGELSTLCDVKACAVIYEPEKRQLEVWPNDHEAGRVLQRLKDMPPEQQSKNMLNQEGYLRERLAKQQAKLRRIMSENHQLEMALLVHDGLAGRSLRGLSMDTALSLHQFIDDKGKMIEQRRLAKAKAAAADASTRENAVVTEHPVPAQQTNWGRMMPTPTDATPTATATNGQMFFGSGSGSGSSTGGLEETAVMANDLMPAQQTNWGPMIPTPSATPTATATATNGQMFFGSSSSSTGRGMEENIMQQPYMNIGTSWMHFPFY